MDEPPIEAWTREVVLREAPSIARALNEHEVTANIERRLRRLSAQQLVLLAALLQAAGFL